MNIILNKLKDLLILSKDLSEYVNNFNDVILDCTKSYKVINSAILNKTILRIIKLGTFENIKNYNNLKVFHDFELYLNSSNPDDNICLLISEDLNFLKDTLLCDYIVTLNIPIILTSIFENFKVKSSISRETITYVKTEKLRSNYYLYMPKSK